MSTSSASTSMRLIIFGWKRNHQYYIIGLSSRKFHRHELTLRCAETEIFNFLAARANRRGRLTPHDPNFDDSISGNRVFTPPVASRLPVIVVVVGVFGARNFAKFPSREDPLDRGGDAIVVKDSARSCTHTSPPLAAIHLRRESNLRAAWSAVRTAAAARAPGEEEWDRQPAREGSPRDGGSKNARLRAQSLCLSRRVVARRCGGEGNPGPRGGHQGSASGPWRTSSELHPLSRPLNPRAVRLVRVCLPRSTVRPSIRSFVCTFVVSPYRPLLTLVASDAFKWNPHVFPVYLPRDCLCPATVVRQWCSILGESGGAEPAGPLPSLDFSASRPPHAGRSSSYAVDANLSCMVSTLLFIRYRTPHCLAALASRSGLPSPGRRFTGVGWKGRVDEGAIVPRKCYYLFV